MRKVFSTISIFLCLVVYFGANLLEHAHNVVMAHNADVARMQVNSVPTQSWEVIPYGPRLMVKPAGLMTDQRVMIVCEVIGAYMDTQGEPGWGSNSKPVHGYCFHPLDPHRVHVKVDPNWPINLGQYNNKVGIECAINQGGYGIVCDWP